MTFEQMLQQSWRNHAYAPPRKVEVTGNTCVVHVPFGCGGAYKKLLTRAAIASKAGSFHLEAADAIQDTIVVLSTYRPVMNWIPV